VWNGDEMSGAARTLPFAPWTVIESPSVPIGVNPNESNFHAFRPINLTFSLKSASDLPIAGKRVEEPRVESGIIELLQY
jgi:hypothetical protein